MPPKSKGTDLVTRAAVALSTVNYVISAMLNGEPTSNPPETITEQSCNKATVYVQHLHVQKEMFTEFIRATVEPATEKPRLQPKKARESSNSSASGASPVEKRARELNSSSSPERSAEVVEIRPNSEKTRDHGQ